MPPTRSLDEVHGHLHQGGVVGVEQRGVVAVALHPQLRVRQARRQLPRSVRVSGLVILAGAHERGLFHAREVLLHARLPSDRRPPSDQAALSVFIHDLAGVAGVAPPDVSGKAFRGLDRDVLQKLALDVIDQAGLAPGVPPDELRLRMRVFTANVQALCAYRPSRYEGRVVLMEVSAESVAHEYAQWHGMCPHLERRTVPGDHYTVMRPPHLAALAAAVRDVLSDETSQTG